MTAKANIFENDLMLLLFNNVAIADIGDVAGLLPSAAGGSLYLSLHTAEPGEAGDQTTNEIVYTSYARIAVARNSGAWTVVDNAASNTAIASWPQCTGGSGTATHFGIGTSVSGAGKLLYRGPLDSNLAISNLITPEAAIGDIVATES